MDAAEGEDGAGGREADGGEDDHVRDDALGLRDGHGRAGSTEARDDRAHRLGERVDELRALDGAEHARGQLCKRRTGSSSSADGTAVAGAGVVGEGTALGEDDGGAEEFAELGRRPRGGAHVLHVVDGLVELGADEGGALVCDEGGADKEVEAREARAERDVRVPEHERGGDVKLAHEETHDPAERKERQLHVVLHERAPQRRVRDGQDVPRLLQHDLDALQEVVREALLLGCA